MLISRWQRANSGSHARCPKTVFPPHKAVEGQREQPPVPWICRQVAELLPPSGLKVASQSSLLMSLDCVFLVISAYIRNWRLPRADQRSAWSYIVGGEGLIWLWGKDARVVGKC